MDAAFFMEYMMIYLAIYILVYTYIFCIVILRACVYRCSNIYINLIA